MMDIESPWKCNEHKSFDLILIVCNHKLLSSSFNFLLLLLYPLFSCFLIIEIIIWNNLYSSVQKSCVATRFFIFS